MDRVLVTIEGLLSRLRGTPLHDPVAVVGVLGGALLVAGARLYRLALLMPGLATGMLFGLQLTQGASPELRLAAGLLLGALGAVLMLLAERLAISLAGALLVGGLAHALAPILFVEQDEWYLTVGGAVVGLLLFPRLFRSLLFVFTALGGALCVAWAMGQPQNLGLIGGLWLAGTVIQWLTRPRRGE